MPRTTDAGPVLITGATGLVGSRVLARLIRQDDGPAIYCLVRDAAASNAMLAASGAPVDRVRVVPGDLRQPGLAVEPALRRKLGAEISRIVHCAADTSFSRPLDQARAVNAAGTARLLELAASCRLDRFVHLSTAYVAGRTTGTVPETELGDAGGFVNAYEQSKHEAESLVRRSGLPWTIVRPSTIVCDDASGSVAQHNAVHRALRVLHAGLAAIMPGMEATAVDLVTTDRVVDGVLRAVVAEQATGRTYHLCAGQGALPLGEMLDRCFAFWSTDSEWRRRGIVQPALTDLATYRLFEESVDETGDVRLATITRSLSHFVPQLALPKRFVTAAGDALLGAPAPAVASFWDALLRHLTATRWGALLRRVA